MHSWTTEHHPLENGARMTLHYGKQPLRFAELFKLLATSNKFADWYSAVFRCSDYPAYFWEHPPLTLARLENPAELVLLAAPGLESVRADAGAFAEHFNALSAVERNPTIVSFPNIGGDALLIAPRPDSSSGPYTHLGEFIRNAPPDQIREFWRVIARAVTENIGEQPLWLSTSGLGVAWLHARLDSRPKYYQYRPYTLR